MNQPSQAIHRTPGMLSESSITTWAFIHINLEHESKSHNRGYTQSKTINLAPNHHQNHNHNHEHKHD